MKEEKTGMNFSWRNYLKPTPKILLTIAEYLKGLFVLITSLAAFEAVKTENPWWVIGSACVGYSLDQATKFFAKVDQETRVISMEVPIGTDIQITDEIKDEKPK